jgi:hypothetical protein
MVLQLGVVMVLLLLLLAKGDCYCSSGRHGLQQQHVTKGDSCSSSI